MRGNMFGNSAMSNLAWNLSSHKTDSLKTAERDSSMKYIKSVTIESKPKDKKYRKSSADRSGPIIVRLHDQLNSITQSLNVGLIYSDCP